MLGRDVRCERTACKAYIETKPRCGFDHRFANLSGLRRNIGLLLMLAGVSVLSLPLVLYVQGTRSQRTLERQWEEASPPVPRQQVNALETRGLGDTGTWKRHTGLPVTKLVIPRIGLEAVVVEGTTPQALSKGPGHFTNTARPGEPGNCCIAGHRNMYGSWFRRLDRLSAGDTVILRGQGTEFVYRVTDKFSTRPDDLSVLAQTSAPTLTLITCTPVPKPTQRLVITAELIRDS